MVMSSEQTWARHLISFYRSLEPTGNLPDQISWLHPQKDPEVLKIVESFFHKFFNDRAPRTLLMGINPGRFGAGVTGVNFTAARQLTDYCGIEHGLGRGTELSAEFIYEMIEAYGGPEQFYARHFIGSVSPLGFVKGGKNLNYYDDRQLQEAVEPFIIDNMEKLLLMPVDRQRVFSIGGEKNFKYLSRLNERFRWFETVIPLPHPRFIMQYRRKQKELFVKEYLEKLG